MIALSGCLFIARPSALARRFGAPLEQNITYADRANTLAFAYGLVLIVFALFYLSKKHTKGLSELALHPVGWFAIVALTSPLHQWWVDDAAISFAYSDNLVAGHGLRLHPALPREEAYSNTLWVLLLAGFRAIGGHMPFIAKVVGILSLCASFSVSVVALRRLKKLNESSHELLLLVLFVSAPNLVWSSSGLEHSLQGFLLLVAATAPLFTRRPIALATGCFSLLILLRPETPLLVVFVAVTWFSALVLEKETKSSLVDAFKGVWPLAVVPACVLVLLLAFRWSYFGDFLPTPFYAKTHQASFFSLLNPFEAGWSYLFEWIYSSGVLFALGALGAVKLAVGGRNLAVYERTSKGMSQENLVVTLVVSAILGQVAFIVYAGGDWMACWRFISPLIPLAALLCTWSVTTLVTRKSSLFSVLLAAVLAFGSHRQYLQFLARPTTPYTEVAAIADEFASLGRALKLQSPLLAHHDAGGTSFHSPIQLVDLAGIGDRTIAKNLHDRAFIQRYILETKKPHFVFGSKKSFAAGLSQFHKLAQFEEDYVRVLFQNKAFMQADLSFVRRDSLANKDLSAFELNYSKHRLALLIVQ